MPRTSTSALLLGSGYLCSEDMFGCFGDDEGLAEALAACSTPDDQGWKQIANRDWRRTWRWYGTTSSGARVCVQVQSCERYMPTTPKSGGRR